MGLFIFSAISLISCFITDYSWLFALLLIFFPVYSFTISLKSARCIFLFQLSTLYPYFLHI